MALVALHGNGEGLTAFGRGVGCIWRRPRRTAYVPPLPAMLRQKQAIAPKARAAPAAPAPAPSRVTSHAGGCACWTLAERWLGRDAACLAPEVLVRDCNSSKLGRSLGIGMTGGSSNLMGKSGKSGRSNRSAPDSPTHSQFSPRSLGGCEAVSGFQKCSARQRVETVGEVE